jgi:hypothetical protein
MLLLSAILTNIFSCLYQAPLNDPVAHRAEGV